jgi:hypothetical protein
MAKKKIEDFEVNVDTNKVDIQAKKEGENVTVKVETPNRSAEYIKTEDEQSFKFDGKKLDVEVVKNEEGIKTTVNADNKFVKFGGNLLAKLAAKKIKKNENKK